jgi:hypothetical protein
VDISAGPTGNGCAQCFGGPLDPVGVSAAAPEPSTWAMLLLGFAGLGFAGRLGRKRRGLAVQGDHEIWTHDAARRA